jgi:hypothetical protein
MCQATTSTSTRRWKKRRRQARLDDMDAALEVSKPCLTRLTRVVDALHTRSGGDRRTVSSRTQSAARARAHGGDAARR